jgi:hypothetical protein
MYSTSGWDVGSVSTAEVAVDRWRVQGAQIGVERSDLFKSAEVEGAWEESRRHILQSKIYVKVVPPTCTNHRKSGPNRQPAGDTHIWYRLTGYILGHLETIQGAE